MLCWGDHTVREDIGLGKFGMCSVPEILVNKKSFFRNRFTGNAHLDLIAMKSERLYVIHSGTTFRGLMSSARLFTVQGKE
jgi:hypothetical protein